MLYIINNKNSNKKEEYKFVTDEEQYKKDLPFMVKSNNVLTDMPETWKQYPMTKDGVASIINMEYKELVKTATDEEKKCECVHLASACLLMWRMLVNE